MQTHISQQLAQHLPQQSDFLIGLSGGVDSVALLHLFAKQPNLHLRAVHIHHGLSPNADFWAAFCSTLCQQYDIPLLIEKVNVLGDKGLEANARQARYQAISSLIRPNEVFVTAHHLDDQAETFFLALKRGSGIQGLSAMQAVSFWQNFTIFRPLLSLSKNEIIAFAEQEKLHWICDESNENDEFDRNFLRNQILPQLNQRWAAFSKMVARAAEQCAEQQALIETLLAEERDKRMGERQQLDITGFADFSNAKQQQLVRLWLAKCGEKMPSQALLQAVISELIFAKQDKNPQVKLGEKTVRRYQQAIFLTENSLPTFNFNLDIPPIPKNTLVELPNNLGYLERTAYELICKILGKTHRLPIPKALENELLTLKFSQSGKVKIYGKPQREEMKKMWQRHQIPVWERQSTPLLFWQDELLAISSQKS